MIRSGAEQRRARLVVDLGRRDDAQTADRLPVEGSSRLAGGAVDHQVGGLVVHAAVDVHATVVGQAAVEQRARHPVGIAVRAGSTHVADRADRQLFAEQPSVVRWVWAAGRAPEVDQLAHHVAQRLVDRARLGVVQQVRRVLRDAVGQFVPDDVVGVGIAGAVEHLVAVPERVGVGGAVRAESNGRLQRHAGVVDAVAAQHARVEVVGHSREFVRDVHLGRGDRSGALGADRRGARRRRGVVVVAHPTVLGVSAAGEVEDHRAVTSIDEDHTVDVADVGTNVHLPDEADVVGGPLVTGRRSDQRRVVDDELGCLDGQLTGVHVVGACGDAHGGRPGGARRNGRLGLDPCGCARLAGGRTNGTVVVDLDRDLTAEHRHVVHDLTEPHRVGADAVDHARRVEVGGVLHTERRSDPVEEAVGDRLEVVVTRGGERSCRRSDERDVAGGRTDPHVRRAARELSHRDDRAGSRGHSRHPARPFVR